MLAVDLRLSPELFAFVHRDWRIPATQLCLPDQPDPARPESIHNKFTLSFQHVNSNHNHLRAILKLSEDFAAKSFNASLLRKLAKLEAAAKKA